MDKRKLKLRGGLHKNLTASQGSSKTGTALGARSSSEEMTNKHLCYAGKRSQLKVSQPEVIF